MKLIKYLKTVMIDPCENCLVKVMCSRVCDKLLMYHNKRDNIIANIIVVFIISVIVTVIAGAIYITTHL
jgi:hypothetical protein